MEYIFFFSKTRLVSQKLMDTKARSTSPNLRGKVLIIKMIFQLSLHEYTYIYMTLYTQLKLIAVHLTVCFVELVAANHQSSRANSMSIKITSQREEM